MRDGIKLGAASILGVILVFLLAILIGSMYVFGWGFFQRSTADFRGETAQTEAVQADPNYRIAAYDHFFDLCTGVQNDEARIHAQEQELQGDPKPSVERQQQININLGAIRSSRDSKINRYNNDARKQGTLAQFRDSNLPYQLNINAKETQCIA